MTLKEIQEATVQDETLQSNISLIRNSNWENLTREYQGTNVSELQLFKRVKDELTVNDDQQLC